MDDFKQLSKDFIQLARTSLTGRVQDIQLLLHRATKRYKDSNPQFVENLLALLRESPSRSSPLRKHSESALPVDIDSRLQLLKVISTAPEHPPILSTTIRESLRQVLAERENVVELGKHGLIPTKSILFTGEPGIGKTLSAQWLASQLNKPLLVLDLTAVMSSFLGRTGNNIRYVLDYAKQTDCVLLLDEIDSLAKRRDDATEIGELKRLVTVLLQEVDDWPASGLLLAATNHPDLLDPAIWRRFDMVLKFEMPTVQEAEVFIIQLIDKHIENPNFWGKILSFVFGNVSFSEIERRVNQIKKTSVITATPLEKVFQSFLDNVSLLKHDDKIELAAILDESGVISQRRVTELTGVSRDTIRKRRNQLSKNKANTTPHKPSSRSKFKSTK